MDHPKAINVSIDDGDDPVAVTATIDNDDVTFDDTNNSNNNNNNDNIPVATATVVTTSTAATSSTEATAQRYDSRRELHLPSSTGTHTEQIRQNQINLLKDQGFTTGLAHALYDAKSTFPLRIWVVDNSGSMQASDGNRFVETKINGDTETMLRMVSCTRWVELQECVKEHIDLAGIAQAPTSFRLLNDPIGTAAAGNQYFDVASAFANVNAQVHDAKQIISSAVPRGVTPLTKHIHDIRDAILEQKDELIARNQRVSLILATDGLPTDNQGHGGKEQQQDFIEALRSLEGLPLWIVIRLCTDESDVVQFYSEILDYNLELSIDLLDDYLSECKEIKKFNPWLNYGLPLHRLREMGFHDRLFDMIDERRLTHQELLQFCKFLFGQDHTDALPDPAIDWMNFKIQLDKLNHNESTQWNPMKYKTVQWINMKKLEKIYGDGSTTGVGKGFLSIRKKLFSH